MRWLLVSLVTPVSLSKDGCYTHEMVIASLRIVVGLFFMHFDLMKWLLASHRMAFSLMIALTFLGMAFHLS